MIIAVRYFSKSGRTKKLADEIAKELNLEAFPISKKLTEDVDVLFLGSGVYANSTSKEVKEFINSIDTKIGEVVNFSTGAITKSTFKSVKKLVEAKNINMSEKEYCCLGTFGLMHKNRPNEEDIKSAGEFTKNYINQKEK